MAYFITSIVKLFYEETTIINVTVFHEKKDNFLNYVIYLVKNKMNCVNLLS